MRRALLVFGIFAMVGCGISAVATRDGAGPAETEDATPSANLPDTSSPPFEGGPVGDAGFDADSALPTFPSHINTADYTPLSNTAVSITAETTINTSDMNGLLNGTDPIVLTPGTQGPDPIAVWSVGALTLSGLGGSLTVTGNKALVIVVNGDLTSGNAIRAAASVPGDEDEPGPGGTTPGVTGSGGPGQSSAAGGGGGGGGGNASAGARGGNSNGAGAGSPGVAMTSRALLGGHGGGNGAGFASTSACARGGNGGGAIQLSVMGKITFTGGSIIDVSGGGGHGGCKSSGSTAPGAGGGGGAGGLIYIEALGDIASTGLNAVVASGGAGGEGGDNNDGKAGKTPDFYNPSAAGGSGGGSGGNGGNGATGNGADAGTPEQGVDTNAAAGGGGGATGRVFFRTRPPATLVAPNFLYAFVKTETF